MSDLSRLVWYMF